MKFIKTATNNRIFLPAFFSALIFYSQPDAYAQTCPTNASPGSSNCSNLEINTSIGGVDIGGTLSSLTAAPAVDLTSAGSVTTMNITGTVTSNRTDAITNKGGITSLTNSGVISSAPPYGGVSGINNLTSSAIISVLTNTGSISSISRGITNQGTIGSMNNGGSIVAPYGIFNQGGTISSITNTGAIAANGAGNSHAILNIIGTIGTITNSGSINSRGIDSLGSDASYAISNAGTINTITNIVSVGTTTSGIYGASGVDINNTGTIKNLNNAQNNLVLQGNLPTNYNVIISSPTSYGGLTYYPLAGTAATQTNFGIEPSSSLKPNTTYSNMVTGVSVSNFAGGVAPSGRFGTGAMVTQIPWYLTNSGANWSLVSQPNPVQSTDPTVPGTSSGTSLASAISGASAAAVNGGSNPTLANGTTLAAAAQNLTGTQVNQLINAHAEGYSSNMTIGLEQMNNLANTVMDRIHKPISSSSTTSVSYQVDEGRYIWIDLAGFNGNVRDNNNLAGFGYNQYNSVIGGDLLRNQTGGFGIFGGVGYSNMTNSQQVVQSFNNTTYYTGLYGGLYLPGDMKLSGAFGYVYGNSNVSRSNPNIGSFTGGTAKDSYNTNGTFAAMKLAKSFLATENLTLTPFVGASYSQQWTGGINEAGGGDFNYSISNSSAYTAITFVGGEFILPVAQYANKPLSVIGSYRFGYNWFANTASAHSITANSPIFGSFNQTGANMGPVSNTFGLGLQGSVSEAVSLRAGVMAALNTYGNQIGAGAELRVRF